jgi:hypothetical protein
MKVPRGGRGGARMRFSVCVCVRSSTQVNKTLYTFRLQSNCRFVYRIPVNGRCCTRYPLICVHPSACLTRAFGFFIVLVLYDVFPHSYFTLGII